MVGVCEKVSGVKIGNDVEQDGGMTERSAGKEKDSMAVELGALLWERIAAGGINCLWRCRCVEPEK